jgi:uncharacterized protein (TIRG00374 family)
LPLVIALVVLIAQVAILAARWRLLLPRRADGTRVDYRSVTEALLVGNLANAILPGRLGEIARAVAIARRGSVDGAQSFGVVVLERILDVAVLAGIGAAAGAIANAPPYLVQPLALGALACLALLGLLMTGLGERLVASIATWTERRLAGPRRATAMGWITRLVAGLHAGQRPTVTAVALAVTVVSVLLDGVIFWLVGRSLSVELSWAQAMLMGTAGVLVTGIPSAPANIGTFELAVAWVGASVGVPTEAGLAVALVAHLIIVVPPSLGGAVVLLSSVRSPSPSTGQPTDG